MSSLPRTCLRSKPQIVFSLDVEEFDIPLEYGHSISFEEQVEVSSIGLARVLALLESLHLPATCFTTATFALARKTLIRTMASAHEIASHGYAHSTFEEKDLKSSREVLSELSGQPVYGFRRPRFAPTSALAVAAAGYTYHSSENPIWLPGRYNGFFRPRLPYQTGALWQIPVSASPLIRFPFFWLSFKNLPLSLFKAMTQWTLRQDGVINLIFHPWEFAEIEGYGLPMVVRRVQGEKLIERLRNYLQWLQPRGHFTTFHDFAQSLPKSS